MLLGPSMDLMKQTKHLLSLLFSFMEFEDLSDGVSASETQRLSFTWKGLGCFLLLTFSPTMYVDPHENETFQVFTMHRR